MRTTGSGHNWLGDANHINSAYRVDSSNCKLSIRAFTRDGAEAFFVPEEFQERVTCRDGNSGVQLVNYNLETDEVFISNSNFGNCNPPTPTEPPTVTEPNTTTKPIATTTKPTTVHVTTQTDTEILGSGSGSGSNSNLTTLPSAKPPEINAKVIGGTIGTLVAAGVVSTIAVAAGVAGRKIYNNRYKDKIDIETPEPASETEPDIELKTQI